MATLTVIATIVAKPESAVQVKQVLLDLIPPTRLEPGCIKYELNQDREHPHVFVFAESWESRDLHAAHMASPHLLAFPARVEGMIDHWDVKLMDVIG